MLPPEAFKPRSPSRSMQYNNYQDDYYGSYYGGNKNTSASYSGSNYEVNRPFYSCVKCNQAFV